MARNTIEPMEEQVPAKASLVDGQKDQLYRENFNLKRTFYRRFKRLQDILLSLVAILMLSPLFVIIALAIVVDDPSGSPFFIQARVGKDGRKFQFYKFRSMVVNAEAQREMLQAQNEVDGPVFKIKDDPRITRVGRFIRRTSLDELPQLLNVLKGDMSLVGPRPALPREVEQYDEYAAQRLLVTPGLTCYWQVMPGRHQVSFDEWVRQDLRYIQDCSFITDWKIIFQTFKVILSRDSW